MGEAANVPIADPDANENAAVANCIRVFTSSSSAIDQAGVELSANETGNDTVAFRVAFRIVSQTVDDHDEIIILANGNDKVVISYTDRHMLPIILTKSAVAKTLKRNSFLKSVSRSLTERRKLSCLPLPILKDLKSNLTIREYALDSNDGSNLPAVAVSVSIANAGGGQALEFAAVIEARDHSGAIVFLAWDNSTLT